jgi:hypothetical protein
MNALKSVLKTSFCSFLIITVVSCESKNEGEENVSQKPQELENLPPKTKSTDTILLTETFQEDDVIANEYLTKELEPIRKNFKRINSTNDWTAIKTQEIWETTEGGEANYYYSGDTLEKIVLRLFGENFQLICEFYMLNGKLSFVFEKSYNYNRPIFWDSIVMKENNDKQIFDVESSEIQEERSYFENGKLLHISVSSDCGAPFADEYLLEEQKRLTELFERLLVLSEGN